MSIEYYADTIIKRDDGKEVHPVKAMVGELFNFIQDDISNRDDVDHISFGLRLNLDIDDSYINVVDALFEQVLKYFNKALKGIDKDNAYDKVCGTFDDYCEYHKIDHMVEGRVYYDKSIEYYVIDACTFKPSKEQNS